MTRELTPQQIIAYARQCLATARQGLGDLTGPDPNRHVPGMHNAIVFGRSVTFILQTFRTIARKRFDEWYEPRVAAMKDDPLLRWFSELRNRILKQGVEHHASVHISHLCGRDLAPLMKNPPPRAKGFFIGDNLGGSGWEIQLPDGSTEAYYVALPPEIAAKITTALHLPNPPDSHLGQPLTDTSVDTLLGLYLDYMEGLVGDAETEFASL